MEFNLKQHLKLGKNSKVINLVPEHIDGDLPETEWKLGRIWYNTIEDTLKTIVKKKDINGNIIPDQLMAIPLGGSGSSYIEEARDGEYYPDGLLPLTNDTKVGYAVDDINEVLKDLAPANASPLTGNLVITPNNNIWVSGYLSDLSSHTDFTNLTKNKIVAGEQITYGVTVDSLTVKNSDLGIVSKGQQQQQFAYADDGILKFFKDTVAVDDGINLGTLFYEPARNFLDAKQGFDQPLTFSVFNETSGQVETLELNPNKNAFISSTGILKVGTVEPYNNFKKWQKGSANATVTNLEQGLHTFKLTHENVGTNTFSTNEAVIFFDPNISAPTTTLTDFTFVSGVTKKVSGIAFFNTNITFNFSASATECFNYLYWQAPISYTFSGSTTASINWNNAASNLISKTVPSWDDTLSLSNVALSVTKTNYQSESALLSIKAGKPASGYGAAVNSNIPILIDTYPISNNSTRIKETFLDEEYRIDENLCNFDDLNSVTANKTNSWDSERPLLNGQSQIFLGKLVKASRNFSTFPNNLLDYTPYANTSQTFYRSIWCSAPNSNGKIRITTNTLSSQIGLNKNIEIYIKLPGLTGWLDITKSFDTVDFENNKTVDGTGANVSITSGTGYVDYVWSCGTLSTVDSGFLYTLKIVINNSNSEIFEIAEIGNGWIN